jgi:PAT family beta-lactamase induction signal transducer AmpG
MTSWEVFRSRRMAVLFVLGFSSGIPYYLTSLTLQAWMTSVGIDIDSISAFASVGLAYALKFAWAPLLDRFRLPILGRRRGWVLACQLGLLVSIAAMGMIDPAQDPEVMAVAAVIVAALSASQDVVLDAYNADLLRPEERAAGSGIYVFGYRTAMVVSSTVALVLADHVPWRVVYLAMAALVLVGIAGTLAAEEPASQRAPTTFAEALSRPFIAFVETLGVRGAVLAIGFAAIYKFGDQFAQVLMQTFLQREVGYSMTRIAEVYQLLGLAGTALGGFGAGAAVARFGLRPMLIGFGALQAATNLLYAWLAVAGPSMPIFCTAVLTDNLANAMGTAAFVAYLMSVCTSSVSATQLALLTSLSSVGQRVFGPLAGRVEQSAGWPGFFAVTTVLAIPGLILAWWAAGATARDRGG